MRVSLKWLADYVDLTLPAEEIAQRLTMSGAEVSSLEHVGAMWENIFVGQIKALDPHPNADRLQLITVDYGQGTTTVVAGAFNVKVGDKVPIALVGARVFDPYADERKIVTVKPAKLRGIVSQGMCCSQRELGIAEDHSGIMVIDAEAVVGRPLQEELGDVILEIDSAANRPDLLSMIGVAREVAALTGQKVRVPPTDYPAQGEAVERRIAIEILDPDLCSRYSATFLEGVRIGPSPKWMRDRLSAAGMRPINNIVDVTNYVMLEWGQPLHAFDHDRLRGGRIIVRRAHPEEQMVTLDGADRALNPDMLVIADAERAVAIAGVMGGGDTEVTEKTRNVLLESANFNPASIRRTSRGLRLPSEAARRFEKGLPADHTVTAAQRATRLMQELASGSAAPGIGDCYPRPQAQREIDLTSHDVRRILGVAVAPSRAAEILSRLGFTSTPAEDGLRVRVPIWRGDVALPADLTEELARMIGYDNIPTTPLSGPLPEQSANETRQWEKVARDALVAAGFAEIICYSLTSKERLGRLITIGSLEEGPAVTVPEADDRLLAIAVDRLLAWTAWPPIDLVNPLSADFASLRITAFGSLLESLRDNLRHETKDTMLFELGRIYIPHNGELPIERRVLTAVTGEVRSDWPWGNERPTDFFDLKGTAEVILDRMGIPQVYVSLTHPLFQPGRAAAILTIRGEAVERELIGVVGEVNPLVLRNFDIGERAYLLGLDFDRLVGLARSGRRYEPLPRYPAVRQDIALIISDEVAAVRLRDIIFAAGGDLVRDVALFDVYRGAPIPEGQKSLAFRITFQSTERTLTDEEANDVRQRIVAALVQEAGATLRG